MIYNIKIKVTILACSLLFLTACQGVFTDAGNQQNNAANSDASIREETRKNAEQRVVDSRKIEINNLLKLQDQLNAVVLTRDIKKCAEIKNEIYFASCNAHILGNQAIEQKKPEVCDQGKTDEIKQSCQNDYAQATKPAAAVIDSAASTNI